jgi:hypothetical protein
VRTQTHPHARVHTRVHLRAKAHRLAQPARRGRGPPADTQPQQAYGEVDADNTPKLMSIHVTDIDIKIMLAHYRLLAAVYAE